MIPFAFASTTGFLGLSNAEPRVSATHLRRLRFMLFLVNALLGVLHIWAFRERKGEGREGARYRARRARDHDTANYEPSLVGTRHFAEVYLSRHDDVDEHPLGFSDLLPYTDDGWIMNGVFACLWLDLLSWRTNSCVVERGDCLGWKVEKISMTLFENGMTGRTDYATSSHIHTFTHLMDSRDIISTLDQ